jgi:hypothetical protein
MKCGLNNYDGDQDEYAKQNDGEDNRERPEKRRRLFLADVSNGVLQREDCRYNAEWGKGEGGHECVELTRPLAAMGVTVKSGQKNRKNVGEGKDIGNCQGQFT